MVHLNHVQTFPACEELGLGTCMRASDDVGGVDILEIEDWQMFVIVMRIIAGIGVVFGFFTGVISMGGGGGRMLRSGVRLRELSDTLWRHLSWEEGSRSVRGR